MLVREFGVPYGDLAPVERFTVDYTEKVPPVEVDPATYEVLRHRLWWALITMSETLKKVSGTIVTAEGNDMSTYITLEDGSPVYLGPYVALHAGIADILVSRVIEEAGSEISPGDMIFCNDPWMGPVHQPDCALLSPFFVDGEVFAWVGVTLHQLDMGGIDPGGLCPNAKDAFGEPHIYPGVKLVDRGEFRRDIDRMLRRNSRMPDIVALDVRSMVSGNHAAVTELQDLVKTYSPEVVRSVMIEIQEEAKREMQARLSRLPRGAFRGIDRNEVGGAAPHLQDDVYEVQCTLRNTGEKLIYDFSGTSKQSGGFANCGFGGLRSACLMSLMESVAYGIPWNAGISSCMEIWTQPGTVNNPTWPAAVSDGITEGAVTTAMAAAQAVSNWLALSDEMDDKAGANGGNFLGNTLGGIDENGRIWGTLLLDSLVQSYGPTKYRDGKDMAGAPGIPYTQVVNVEQNELHYPMLYLYRRTGQGSGGAGKHRGGNAIEFAFTPHLVPFVYMLLWNHGAEFPNTAPMDGGLPNGANRFLVASMPDVLEGMKRGELVLDVAAVATEQLGAKSERILSPGDLVLFAAQGTPGFGDPLGRDPASVAMDVAAGIYSSDVARALYGVVLRKGTSDGDGASGRNGASGGDGDGTGVAVADEVATRLLRERCRRARLALGRPVRSLDDMAPFLDLGGGLGWEALLGLVGDGGFGDGGTSGANGGGSGVVRGRPSGTLSHPLVAFGEALEIVEAGGADGTGGGFAWACGKCDTIIAPASTNPKLAASVLVLPLNTVHPWGGTVRTEAPRFSCRSYLCPHCGATFAAEVARPDDPVIWEAEPDREWLEKLRKPANHA